MQKAKKKILPVLVITLAIVALSDDPGAGQRLKK